MTDLATLQTNLLEQVAADHAYFLELIQSEEQISQNLILSLQKELESLMAQVKSNHSSLVTNKKPTEAVTRYLNDDIFTQFRRKYHNYWADLEEKIVREASKADSTLNATAFHDTTIGGSRNFKIKLPVLTLPTFSGELGKWKTFYNSFISLVGDNQSLTIIDKFRYLKDSLVSEPKGLIDHLELEESNYDVALKILADRYDHKRLLVNIQLNTIYNLEQMKKESAVSIRKMIDTLRECYQSLKVLGIDVEKWDPVIIFLVQNKLPLSLNQLWEEKLSNSKELASFSQFESFLECRFRTLDVLTPRMGSHSSNSYHIQNQEDKCKICNQSHFITSCKKFVDADPVARYNLVIKNHLCINCLSSHHMLDRCSSNKNCRKCNKRHHTFLHKDNNSKPTSNATQSNSKKNHSRNKNKGNGNPKGNQSQSSQVNTTLTAPMPNPNPCEILPTTNSFHINSISKSTYLLGTAVVQITNSKGNVRVVRALIDPGSEDSYIIDSIVNGLPLKKYYAPSSISVIGGEVVEGITHRCNFTLKSLHNEFELKIDAGIKSCITPDLPKEPIPGLCYSFLNNLKLADPSFDEPGQIHLLLGMGVWVQIAQPGIVKNNSLMAQKTTLGWMVQGVTHQTASNYRVKPSRCLVTHSLENQIQKFWELERVGEGKVLETPENILCEEIVSKSIQQLEDRKLAVDLPFKNNTPPILGNSKEIAKRRFFNLEKKLNQNPKLKEEYHKTIQEYLDCGHMKSVADTDCGGKEYFLPHHAVFKESSTTTKVRVVFDASCKTTDSTSLNDHLLTGKKLQVDIRDILLRWRQYPIVLSADVEKMYRQFWINEKYHNYQKILWRFSEFDPLRIYSLTTVTFGTSAAPFLALRLLKYIATSDNSRNFPSASKAVNEDFYVDDLMTGCYSQQEAITTQTEIRELLSQFGLTIRKWCSNNLSVLNTIPAELCEISEHLFDETDYKKTLGIYWSPSLDSFAFSVEEQDFQSLKLTKRKTLSLIARLYDPLGWLGPCTTYAKIIMQRIWQSMVGWDEEIPTDLKTQFSFFLKDLQSVNSISIPRWIQLTSKDSPITLLGFADASELGYGCVVYLKGSENQSKNILLTSRSRIAPLNFTTIARLELCAALLLSEVLEWCEQLFVHRQITIHAFSDSKIVLSWLQDHPSRWKTFVANRTSEILKRYDRSHWHYINTKENPADFISRGLLPSEIVSNKLWWNGPTNLELDHPFSHVSEHEQKIMQHEQKSSKSCLHAHNHTNDLISYFSSNLKLFKRINTICTFAILCLRKCIKSHPIKKEKYLLLIQKLSNPEHVVLRVVQQEGFSNEITALTNKKDLARDSKLRTLSPFIDGFGLLRSGSRLENSELLSYDQKYPIILPSHHQVTTNVIHEAHAATLHGTFKLTFAYIRNKFHIMRGKDRINFFRRRCIPCIRQAKMQQEQLMGSLPFPRVNQFKPFLFSGVDFAGPMLIRNKFSKGSKTSKSYIAIFVCLCTKAIHIELVSDLTSEAFLASLRRFVYRRGRCQVMHSDCGTNFKGASKTLLNECHEAQKTWKNDLQPRLEELGIAWEFNPPASPHFGGLWEAGVKSIKTHLNKTLGDAILTFEEYYTVLVQIEGILNSRPLCPISDDPSSYEALTPSHFLVGEALVAPPEPKFEPKKTSSLKRWRYLQILQQKFWEQWRGTYLHSLSKRPKWLSLQRNFQVDDLVLVTEDNFVPTIWPLARIIEVHPGKDGLVRVVTLRTATGKIFKRPIAKLRFLPVATEEETQPLSN